MTRYINVLISRNTDRLFTYSVLDALDGEVSIGRTVEVPFRNRRLTAFVVEFVAKPDYPVIRDMLSLSEAPPLFSEDQISIAHQIADHYQASFLSALYLYLPPDMDKKDKQLKVVEDTVRVVSLQVVPAVAHELAATYRKTKKTELMAAVIDAVIREGGSIPYQDIEQRSSLKTLLARNVLVATEVLVSRLPKSTGLTEPVPQTAPVLTSAQAAAVEQILAPHAHLFLLHGVTGSGKTEVYLQVIHAALEQGKGAIVLVPEISLTPQTLSRFYQRFGTTVAVMHSSLGDRDRAIQWYKVFSGECRIVVGARSALFAPVKDLGVIIIDEEHETSYKQESTPRYSAITVAGWIARKAQAKLVLGSATPSIERYYFALQGVLKLVALPERVHGQQGSCIQIVDMKKEQEAGYSGYFSRELVQAIRQALDNREQVMLLLNRRGFAPFIICKQCGHTLTCPHCEVSLTLHNDQQLYCHYCGYKVANKLNCPECGHLYFKFSGVGTQKLEQELMSFFPRARVLRMDRDSTSRLGTMEAILSRFASGQADILLGTQMIAKGHDFDNVGLVGVISADVALGLPDFRAAERTYALLSQVAGRTGRRGKPGKVLIQTYNPENEAIAMVEQNHYPDFYAHEIQFRQDLDYPPFVRLGRMIFQASTPEVLVRFSQLLAPVISPPLQDVQVFGPMPAPVAKISGKHRWHLIIKSKSIHGLQKVVKLVMDTLEKNSINMSWTIDIDPVSLL